MSSQLGKLIDGWVLQADTTDSRTIKKGQTLRITDLEGQQVADFVAWKQGDPDEYQHVVYTNFALSSLENRRRREAVFQPYEPDVVDYRGRLRKPLHGGRFLCLGFIYVPG